MIKIFKIKSMLPLTEYAPKWDISVGVKRWEDEDKVDAIRNWLIANEDRIKKEYPALHDGGTGLGDQSVTSRFGRYNLFDFADECPELGDLLNFIRLSWIEFVEKDQTPFIDLEIVCWYNIVRENQTIVEHSHGAVPTGYLSGNMHLDDYETRTLYRTPFLAQNYMPIQNMKGGLSFFPSYVFHKTDEYKDSSKPRLSIAFDLRLRDDVDQYLKSIPFMNPQIFEQVAKRKP